MQSRKNVRIPDFDYSQPGMYFVTICTKERKQILSRVVGDDAHIVPLEYGKICEKYIMSMPGIEKYIIMPNHIHILVSIENGTMWASSPTVSQRIKSFKTLVTKQIGGPIFQRSFYDHVIRDENDFQRIWNYIDTNPQKWAEDKYYIQD